MRVDDPLAFGIDRLRDARATYGADLHHLAGQLPHDPRPAFAAAEADLRRTQEHVRHAEHALTRARRALEQASQRHWGRRDKPAIERAATALRRADTTLALAQEAQARAREHLADQQRAVDTWTSVTNNTADERARLTAAIAEIGDALDATRTQRVTEAVYDPGHKLWRALGPPPVTRGGLAAWCGIAQHLEHANDQHPDRPIDRTLADARGQKLHRRHGLSRSRHELGTLLDHAPDLIDIASELDPAPAGQTSTNQTDGNAHSTPPHTPSPPNSPPQSSTMGSASGPNADRNRR